MPHRVFVHVESGFRTRSFLSFVATILNFHHQCSLPCSFIGGGVCSTISPPRCAGSTGYPGEAQMLELNLLFTRIKNMQERVDALRGYL